MKPASRGSSVGRVAAMMRSHGSRKISVIISTYNNPQSLRMCLLGMRHQTRPPDQIIIADDGSRPDTAAVLREPIFADLPLESVWHPDDGWRKCRILNLAITFAAGDYLIFSDGDTIPRKDFVASHLRYARRRTFLSGSCVNIPQPVFHQFRDAEIISNAVFDVSHLKQFWPQIREHTLKLSPGILESPLNYLTWRYCVLRGANFSAWREDLVRVNGFNEKLVYGSEDRELGVRLRNSGVASRWLKYSLVQLHLDHSRSGYLNHEIANRQRWEFRKLFFTGKSRADEGLAHSRERCGLGGDPSYTHEVVSSPTRSLPLRPFPATHPFDDVAAVTPSARAA